jgi:DNA invertase Pin-like site-specific DNA recombinase
MAMNEATTVLVSAKIGPVHLGRDAYVYVRQSTLTQLREHTESLIRQYELRERAVALGWDTHQVRVIDVDLGRSGAEATGREGFKDLVADVGLGRVGIIFGIEVSRLARNNADWYQLLDLCALTDTLIADTDGVYHPADFNDRLVLGLKGTMSEAELHLIRSRLTAGLRHKAERGELRQFLPVGFDYDHEDRIVLSADEAVAEAIATVFRRFAELGTGRQVLLSLRGEGLLLPRRPTRTGRVVWQPATYPAVHDLLTNPVYAGAFVFGRTRTEKRIDATGKVVARTVLLPREQWAVLIPDHHRGFIDWATFEANTARLRQNWRAPRGSGGGAPREGAALLQGRLRCGKCGRLMQTGYSGAKGNCPRYVCARAKQLYGGRKAAKVWVGGGLRTGSWRRCSPSSNRPRWPRPRRHSPTPNGRTPRRCGPSSSMSNGPAMKPSGPGGNTNAVEPENRLVARTLERGLEGKLAAQRQAEQDLLAARARRPVRLTDNELAWLSRAGADIRGKAAGAPTSRWR